MPIVATAGHVDHGKSTLVTALTGRDPDRWEEEKRRGLTIDLGFAWTDIGGHRAGFVDVPGHERFIKNMLAGVGAVDVALFVVAADEGWMPQSEEHLAILDALHVAHGVVALSRVDLVDPDLAELAAAEVAEHTEGTTLATWPVVQVSALRGDGLDDLRRALAAELDAAGAPQDIGRARMWVDRAFLVGGAGLVVTGTLAEGPVQKGDTVALWPGGSEARVRTIQSHETEVDVVGPGNRVALNLTGIDRAEVPRGTMLGAAGAFAATRRLLARLEPVRAWPGAVTDRGAYHLHAGSGHWPAGVRLLGGKRVEGPTAALLTLDEPVPLRMGDRFVVREVGRRAVVAGGVVLDPRPPAASKAAEAAQALTAVLGADRDAWAAALLDIRGAATRSELDLDTGGGAVSDAIAVNDLVMTPPHAEATLAKLVEVTEAFHDANPMRPGIPAATLASAAGVDQPVLELLITAEGSGLTQEGATVRLTTFGVTWTPEHERTWETAQQRLAAAGLAVPRLSSLDLDRELLHAIVRDDALVIVGNDVAYLPEQIAEILHRLEGFADGFTVSEFRDTMGISRRHAVPLLEWLDNQGWTSRRGDVRTLRRRPKQPADDALLR